LPKKEKAKNEKKANVKNVIPKIIEQILANHKKQVKMLFFIETDNFLLLYISF